ncbi:o-acyltransferase [Anaeramoeba ignava]|uniref:O-acyltransferase n=1 Tax=Anaeramoeba ignava TaxID=1746090 RepID=A0A9Q0RIP6_ANAIG|nr:o-acyltransferase [Anaeramoeba ignava]
MLLGNGPVFGSMKDFIHDTCGKHWYSSLLFFNNFYPKEFDDECISWVWYLANDTQFFVISPIFFYSFYLMPLFGFLVVLAFIITSVVLNFWIVHHWNIVYYTFGSTQEDYSNKIYTKPYTRILPYLAGCLIAMLLNILQKVKKSNEIYKNNININDKDNNDNKDKDKDKDNNDKIEKEMDTDSENEDNQKLTEKTQLIESENENYRKQRDWKIQIIFDYIIPISIFVVSFVLILVMVFVPYDNYKHMGTKWTVGESAIYIGFSKLIWGLSVGGIVFVYSYYEAPKCLIKKFLSLDFWTPLAKLTYNAYLVHPIIMIVVSQSTRILYNYAAMPIFYSTTVYVILSYFFSMIVYFLVERPFMHFEREIITLIKGIKSDATTCQNKYEQEIFGGTEEGLEMVFLATGKDIPTDLGDYDLCNMLPDAHHCVITFGFNISGYVIPLTWGFCLPKECNEEYAPYALEVYISLFYSYASVADYPIDVYCSDTFKKNYSAGTIITLIIIVLFGSFVIIGTIFKYFNISPNSQNQLKFKQNQQNFLNIQDNEIQKETIPKWKTILFKFFSFYSLQINWKKLIEKHPDPSFKHLNGIRALSMFWIIFGHTIYFPAGVGYNNEAYVFGDNGQITKWPFQFILGAEFAVDTFFFLSGLLMAHFAIEKLQHNFNIGCFYFHRFWRLLPSLGFIILFFTNITMLLGNGPVFGSMKDFIHDTCGKHWYSSLLFFNNFYPKEFDDECMGWVWYLANDTQFFVISPIFFYSFYLMPLFGFLVVLVFIITSVVLNFWIVHHWNIVYYTFGSTKDNYSNKIYIKPYTRILPYLAGCLIAMLLNILQKVKKSNEIYKNNININDKDNNDNKDKDNDKDNNDNIEKEIDTDSENEDNQKLTEKTQLIESENENYRKQRDWKIQIIFDYIIPISIFVVSFVLILVMVFVPYDNYKHMGTKWTVGESAIYIGFSKFIWGLSVGGIVFVYSYYEAPKCLIKKFLSLDFWTPLAKLTYNAYLIHPIILIIVSYSSRILYNYAAMPIFYSTTVYIILSYFFSMIVYFLVERPFMHFEREIITFVMKPRK